MKGVGEWIQCTRSRDGWGLVLCGVLLIICAFLHGVIYFSIRAVTTSLDLVETVPNYATALLVSALIINILLSWMKKSHYKNVNTLTDNA